MDINKENLVRVIGKRLYELNQLTLEKNDLIDRDTEPMVEEVKEIGRRFEIGPEVEDYIQKMHERKNKVDEIKTFLDQGGSTSQEDLWEALSDLKGLEHGLFGLFGQWGDVEGGE